MARAGQMIDATFVEVPKQRNSREENAQINLKKSVELNPAKNIQHILDNPIGAICTI